MRPLRYFAAATLLFAPFSSVLISPVWAQDTNTEKPTKLAETVVTADRIGVPREDVGRAIDTRTSDDFKEQETSSATDSLQTVAGVRAQNLGGPGSPGTTPIEIRGFRSSGTQLLFNGLRLNDPSSISGIADSLFAYLTTNDLRSFEVLKGANGTLYGSDGQAGSINMLSEMPTEGFSSDLTFRGGSFTTFEEIAKLNAGTERAKLLSTVTRLDSEGLNEDGNYENTTVSAVGEVNINEEIKVTPVFRMISAMNDLDSSPMLDTNGNLVPNQPTQSNNTHSQAYFYGLTTDYTPCEGFDSRLSLYVNDTKRSYFFDFGGGFESTADYKGGSYNVDWQNSLQIPDFNSVLISGFEYEHQTFDSNSDGTKVDGEQDRYAVFLKDRTAFFDKMLQLDGGVRVTHVSAIDRTFPTFELSGVFKVPTIDTRLHSSFSEGFRAPSLFELNGKLIDDITGELVTVGNKDLKAEETLSFDAGFTQPIFTDKVEFDATFFNLASDETIVFDYPNRTHFNGGGGENQGMEYSLTVSPFAWWKLRGAYTYLAKADVSGLRTQRRPYNVYAVSSSAKIYGATWYTELRYRGSEDIQFFGFEGSYKEGDYTVLDTALTVPVTKNWEVFVRGNNLFDTDYTDSGYRMPGISFFGGIRLKLGADV